jgi:hypothetical protein
MIHIAKFDTEFVGRQFKTGTGTVYTIVGYGDNGSNGNPYLVGLSADSNGNVVLRTERFKDITLLPAATPAT